MKEIFLGRITDKEGELLSRIAKNRIVVEIGSWTGKSTVYLAESAEKVYAIDSHIGNIEQKMFLNGNSSLEIFKENTKDYKNIIPIVKKSQEAAIGWDKPIGLLWIDGDHTYLGAKSDFELYFPFVVDGGIVAFHDTTDKIVGRVVREVFKNNKVKHLGMIDTITYGTKCYGDLSLKEILQKKWILLLNKNRIMRKIVYCLYHPRHLISRILHLIGGRKK